MKKLARIVVVFGFAATVTAVHADVVTSNPSLPVLFPPGVYTNFTPNTPTYNGPGLAIVLSDEQHQALSLISSTPSGPNELEQFNSELLGSLSINGSPFVPITALGPVTTEVFGKIGNVTGTFNTEMLSMNLSGNSPFGPFLIRESPTLPSTGQTTVAPLGGGLYQISSFFDVFTELSLDGGQTWMPASSGSAHVVLVPEPSSFLLTGLAAGLLALSRTRLFRKKS